MGGTFATAVLVPLVTTRVLLGIVGVLSVTTLPVSPFVPPQWVVRGPSPLVDAFSSWDATNYVRIAAQGYDLSHASDIAFFPLYPMTMRLIAGAIGATGTPALQVIGLVVANIALVAATMLLVMLARLDLDEAAASRAAWALLVFPTSLFLSAGYAESLFLALSLGAIVAGRRGRWAAAGLLGALAGLTRPFGVLVLIPLAIEAYQQRHERRRWQLLGSLAAVPLGLAGYMLFLSRTFGDPLAFLHVQTEWHRGVMAPWETFGRFFSAPLTITSGHHSLQDLGFALLLIALAAASWRALRPSYAAYATALVLVPLCTGSLVSMMRFGIANFPIFLVLALAGRSARFERGYLVVAAGLSALLMALFAQWYWVA